MEKPIKNGSFFTYFASKTTQILSKILRFYGNFKPN